MTLTFSTLCVRANDDPAISLSLSRIVLTSCSRRPPSLSPLLSSCVCSCFYCFCSRRALLKLQVGFVSQKKFRSYCDGKTFVIYTSLIIADGEGGVKFRVEAADADNSEDAGSETMDVFGKGPVEAKTPTECWQTMTDRVYAKKIELDPQSTSTRKQHQRHNGEKIFGECVCVCECECV